MTVRRICLPGLAGLLLAAPVPAWAMQGGASGTAQGLADIVVTAQRRAENLQDVPIAITAADGAALLDARVDNISNVQAISPSISFRASNIAATSANVIIRGLGTTGQNRAFEGSVGVFIDGVYRSRAGAALQNFVDIDSLQVLRGPQGTLFGKNTTAGALLLQSAMPDLSQISGMIDLGYGNYDSILSRATANLPLADTAAIRVSGLVSRTNGFFTDATTGAHLNGDATQAIKAQLLFEPSDALSVRLIGDYSRGHGNCCYATNDYIDGPLRSVANSLITAAGRTPPSSDPKKFEATLNGDGEQVTEDYGGVLHIDLELGGGVLRSVTGLRKYRVDHHDVDPEFSGVDIFRYYETFDSRFFSQELTYNGRIDALNADFVLGAFFGDEKFTATRTLPWADQAQAFWDIVLAASGLPPGTVYAAPGLWADEEMEGSAKSYAGFAHLDFAVTDRLNLVAGVRYSVEKKRGAFQNSFYRPQANDVFRVLGLMPAPAFDQSVTDKAVSGTLSLQYRPAEDVMLYASYNRGFKAGGVMIDANAAGQRINNPAEVPGAVPLDPTYKPEKINAFEIGAKTTYLDGRARTNLSLFYYDISNIQIAQFVGLRFGVLNAESAKDYGIEIENQFQLADSLILRADATWLPHARYGTDAQLDPVLQGARFRYAPKLQANVALNLDQPLADNLNMTGRLQYQYSGSQYLSTSSAHARGSVNLLNGNIGFRLPDSGLSAEIWGLNLTNQVYPEATFATTLQTGSTNAFLAPPRTYGIRLRTEF